VKKRLFIVVLSAVALLGIGSGLAPAKAAVPSAPTSVNTAAPLCLKLYVINTAICWRGLY
jgi:hypothetical protein